MTTRISQPSGIEIQTWDEEERDMQPWLQALRNLTVSYGQENEGRIKCAIRLYEDGDVETQDIEFQAAEMIVDTDNPSKLLSIKMWIRTKWNPRYGEFRASDEIRFGIITFRADGRIEIDTQNDIQDAFPDRLRRYWLLLLHINPDSDPLDIKYLDLDRIRRGLSLQDLDQRDPRDPLVAKIHAVLDALV